MTAAPSADDFRREYDRIGYQPGERWPAPPPELGPSELLALLQSVPTGAGVAGWVAALAARSKSRT
jgi:hypothetical protein